MVIFHSYLSLPEGTSYQSSQQKLREEIHVASLQDMVSVSFSPFSSFSNHSTRSNSKTSEKKNNSTTFNNFQIPQKKHIQWAAVVLQQQL